MKSKKKRPSRSAVQRQMIAVQRAKRLTSKKQSPVYPVCCINGPCKGQVFDVDIRKETMFISTPACPFYKYAAYRITKNVTQLREIVAVHTHNIPRKSND